MDIEKLKAACMKALSPIGNMSDAPVLNAIKKGMEFHSATDPQEILNIILELESLRAQLASAQAEKRKFEQLAHTGASMCNQLEAEKAEITDYAKHIESMLDTATAKIMQDKAEKAELVKALRWIAEDANVGESGDAYEMRSTARETLKTLSPKG